MTDSGQSTISLFQLLRQSGPEDITVFQATRSTLVNISQMIEDQARRHKLAALMFTGVYDSDDWQADSDRSQDLNRTGSEVWIFAREAPPSGEQPQSVVTLAGKSLLSRERFLLLLTERFCTLLCAQEHPVQDEDTNDRNFDALLSFDPDIIGQALNTLLALVRQYRPERIATLQATREQFPLRQPDSRSATQILSYIVGQLQRSNNQQREALRGLSELRAQQARLESVVSELAVPVVPLLEGVIVLPLVGSVDTNRAQQIMESLLTGISEQQADVAIIDITGVPSVDTNVANHLIQAIRAAHLLGARVVMTGIGARIAQILTVLGVDFSVITTRSNLRDGIEAALEMQGLHISTRSDVLV